MSNVRTFADAEAAGPVTLRLLCGGVYYQAIPRAGGWDVVVRDGNASVLWADVEFCPICKEPRQPKCWCAEAAA